MKKQYELKVYIMYWFIGIYQFIKLLGMIMDIKIVIFFRWNKLMGIYRNYIMFII